jgi:hypothetical protein
MCPKCQAVTAEGLKEKVMKFLMDAQYVYDHLPELKSDIESIEKKIMKKLNITDEELTQFSVAPGHGD